MKPLIALLFILGIMLPMQGLSKKPFQPKQKRDVVFIAGFDEGNNTYYANAKAHFSTAHYQVVDNVHALAGILDWLQLHYYKTMYNNVHIVSHSNPWRGLSMLTTTHGERITEHTLKNALNSNAIIPLSTDVLNNNTKIIFHSCGLGKNKSLLKLLKTSFTNNTNISIQASEYFNVFGGKYASHYLAKTYYGYYPTAQSPGPRALAKEFKTNYPEVKANWETVLKTRTEQLPGEMYTYKFNIPIEWEFEFEDQADIPNFKSKQELMDWILELDELKTVITQFNIPIEKFRWRSKTKNNTLTIKGKTTVLCVLQPLETSNKSQNSNY